MLTVLGGLCRVRAGADQGRTDEGRKRAQARGVRFGRKLKLTTHHKRKRHWRGARPGRHLAEIGRSYNVSHSTISRLKAENERLHSSNLWLDQQVTKLRAQRDQAQSELIAGKG